MPTRIGLRIATSVLFVIAAIGSYFASAYGAVMNQDMMRNVIETDPAEVGGLFSFDLFAHVVLLGVIPAVLVWRIALPSSTWRVRLRQRLVFIGSALALCAVALFACSANYAVFFREHKPIRYALSPAAPVVSLAGLLSANARRDPHAPLIDAAGNVQRTAAANRKPLVLFLVVGETARAANFQLGGYARATNPRLQGLADLVYFDHATSCGTSTAISVPCMFSHLPRARFDVDQADRYTNLLDTLTKADFAVEWRDNNAGCKGVCARVVEVSYPGGADPVSCPNSYCYDEVMLKDLAARLETTQRDSVVIFHAIGSHGPAYSERYPSQFETVQAGLPLQRAAALQRAGNRQRLRQLDRLHRLRPVPADRAAAGERGPPRQRADLRVGPRRVAWRAGHLSARHAVRLCAARAEGSADAVLGFARLCGTHRSEHGLRPGALARCRSATTTCTTPCWARWQFATPSTTPGSISSRAAACDAG